MTDSGLENPEPERQRRKVQTVRVDMGMPELFPPKIPVDLPGEVAYGASAECRQRDVRNPLRVDGQSALRDFRPRPDCVDLEQIGPLLENNAISPQRANVEFVQVVSATGLRMRVWERGAGETLACGTARVHRLSRR